MYHGKFDSKREVCTLKGSMTLMATKVCLYIHICIYRHLYKSLLSQSSGIQAHSCGFWFHSTGIQRNGGIPAGICGASKSTAPHYNQRGIHDGRNEQWNVGVSGCRNERSRNMQQRAGIGDRHHRNCGGKDIGQTVTKPGKIVS